MPYELKQLRKQARLTQAQLAAALGVPRQSFGEWERSDAIPCELIAVMAEQLGTSIDVLEPLTSLRPRGRPERLEWLPASATPRRPLEDVNCEFGRLLAMGPIMRNFIEQLRTRVGAVAWRVMEHFWPRDSRHELLLACWFLDAGSVLERISLLQLSCDRLIVAEDGQSYAGHQQQWAMVWTSPDEKLRIVLFPQVRMLAPESKVLYRLDFLLWISAEGLEPFFMGLEADGDSHHSTPEQDRDRTLALRLPMLRCENRAIVQPNFFEWLLYRIEQRVKKRKEKLEEQKLQKKLKPRRN